MINEIFNIKNASRTAKDGHEYKIAYIDPQTSENTYQFKDQISKFGAKFFPDLKAWGWILGPNPQNTYDKFIKPCLDYLVSVEDGGKGERKNEVIQIIDDLINELKSGEISKVNIPTAKNITNELVKFKSDLLNCVNSEEFKKRVEPIIKFQRAQGHNFSFQNALLILAQDPEATMVKSKTRWFNMNRMVKPDAKPILLFRPDTVDNKTKEEKEAIILDFLGEVGAKTIKDLTPGQREELDIRVKGVENPDKFKSYFGYDIRFTEQIEGKEELVAQRETNDDWYDKSTDKSEFLSLLIDSATQMIVDSGLTIKYVPLKDLGGALGMARGDGVIVLAKDAEPVLNYANTIIHEFSHELLHLKYFKKSHDLNSNAEWAQFYVGTKQGRGFVEQQAELCAWMVLKHFGFDVTESSLNYTSGWGMTDEKSAAKVFDTIASCASAIMRKLGAYINKDNEDK